MLGWLFKKAPQPDQYGAGRSPQWRAVRNRHVAEHPRCLACGTDVDLEVHHIADFSNHPHLELDQDNLVTLCGTEANGCHLRVGHKGNWRRINPSSVYDALTGRLR